MANKTTDLVSNETESNHVPAAHGNEVVVTGGLLALAFTF
jgi:hypothetical protein